MLTTLLNYFLNFYWSFQSPASHSKAFWRFLLVVAVGFLLNSGYVGLMIRIGLRVELAAVSFALIWPLVSFFSLKLWALRR